MQGPFNFILFYFFLLFKFLGKLKFLIVYCELKCAMWWRHYLSTDIIQIIPGFELKLVPATRKCWPVGLATTENLFYFSVFTPYMHGNCWDAKEVLMCPYNVRDHVYNGCKINMWTKDLVVINLLLMQCFIHVQVKYVRKIMNRIKMV